MGRTNYLTIAQQRPVNMPVPFQQPDRGIDSAVMHHLAAVVPAFPFVVSFADVPKAIR